MSSDVTRPRRWSGWRSKTHCPARSCRSTVRRFPSRLAELEQVTSLQFLNEQQAVRFIKFESRLAALAAGRRRCVIASLSSQSELGGKSGELVQAPWHRASLPAKKVRQRRRSCFKHPGPARQASCPGPRAHCCPLALAEPVICEGASLPYGGALLCLPASAPPGSSRPSPPLRVRASRPLIASLAGALPALR